MDNLSGGGTGLAEIELPSEFKAKNVQLTDSARAAKEDELRNKYRRKNNSNSTYSSGMGGRGRGGSNSGIHTNFRYSQAIETRTELASTETGADGLRSAAIVNGPSEVNTRGAVSTGKKHDGVKHPGNFQHSTDHVIVRKFVNRERKLNKNG